jgi:drug/metabolite transporter (DMT)-like permease
VFWQVLLAAGILSTVAMLIEGVPRIAWTIHLVALLLFSALVCTALAHWAMAIVNRSLPAVTTSLGLLVTPVFGMISASVVLSERLEPVLILALALIVGGIALGTVGDIRATRTTVPAKL